MKRTFLIGLFFVVATAAIFANGSKDEADEWGPRGDSWHEAAEEVSLTGTLVLEDSRFPAIESDGTLYMLMYPRWAVDELDLSEGQEISIEGFLMSGPRDASDEDQDYVRVEKAVIDGKEYDVSEYADNSGRRPMDRGGMHGRDSRKGAQPRRDGGRS